MNKNTPKIISQLFINNTFRDSYQKKTFPVINPSTEELLANVQSSSLSDINEAVLSARTAFTKGPWKDFSGAQRRDLLLKLSDLIEKNEEELSLLESLNIGKPKHIALKSDIASSIGLIRYYAGFADKIQGKLISLSGQFTCYTKHEPIGVCAQILPWNFPLPALTVKLAPALALGCTVVVKPAEQSPLTALRIAELTVQAGFPPGVINILPGLGETAGKPLIEHNDIDKIAFTGSTEVGLSIMRNSHKNKLKRVSLELGGKSPLIICDDADLEYACKVAQGAVFFNTGQICVAGSRVFVHEKIYDKFIERTIELTKARVIGSPLNEKTDTGPLIDEKQREKFLNFVKKGVEEGGNLVIGGKKLMGKGFFVEPTVFSEVTDNMTIAKEEIFGPLMSVLKFKDIDEVIERANNSDFGLCAGILTKNMELAMKFTNELKCGSVWVNCYGVFEPGTVFGGWKNSGLGKEHGEYGLENYTNVKTVIIKN